MKPAITPSDITPQNRSSVGSIARMSRPIIRKLMTGAMPAIMKFMLMNSETGIILAAVITATLGLAMWKDLIVEYLAGFAFGRVYQQTFIDTYAKVACAKLYDRKTPITAADLLNDRVIPFFDSHEVKLLRMLTDRGSEYCGNPERHEYELYLAIEDIDHSRTK